LAKKKKMIFTLNDFLVHPFITILKNRLRNHRENGFRTQRESNSKSTFSLQKGQLIRQEHFFDFRLEQISAM